MHYSLSGSTKLNVVLRGGKEKARHIIASGQLLKTSRVLAAPRKMELPPTHRNDTSLAVDIEASAWQVARVSAYVLVGQVVLMPDTDSCLTMITNPLVSRDFPKGCLFFGKWTPLFERVY